MYKPPDYPDDVSTRSDASMEKPINFEGLKPDKNKEMARMKEEFQKELAEARSKQKKAEEELRFLKQRIAENMSLSQADDTEKMTSPVNKSRLQEMYHRLRVNEWPKLTDRLGHERENPERIQRMIQKVFQEAVDNVNAVKKSLHTICTENISDKEIPKKVQEHLHASMENMQLAIYHNKQAVTPAVLTAPDYCQGLVSECYWLGCLMALNIPPLQLDWAIPTQRMDRWDILPRDITHIAESATC